MLERQYILEETSTLELDYPEQFILNDSALIMLIIIALIILMLDMDIVWADYLDSLFLAKITFYVVYKCISILIVFNILLLNIDTLLDQE